MGTVFGNIIGFVLILVIALVGFFSFEASVITFLSVAYGLYVFTLIIQMLTMPSRDLPLFALLSPPEIQAYRGYHLSIMFPEGAKIYSSAMNALRIAGFVWAGLAVWNGLYWYAAACVAYFFICAHMITRMNPSLYVGRPASLGNPTAMEEQDKLESILQKREIYNL